MSILGDIFNEANAELTKTLVAQEEAISAKVEAKLHNFIKYAETGDISYMVREMEKLRGEDTSSKENVEPNRSVLPKRSTRQRNATLADVSTLSAVPHIRIKQEKMSVASLDSNCTVSDANMTKNDALHKEQSEKMPAPAIVPPRKKKIKEEPTEPVLKKLTRTRTKPKKYLEVPQMDKGKPSDVMIQNTRVTMIDMTDEKGSDTEKKSGKSSRKETDHESTSANETRSTRTRTRQKKKQKEENTDTDTEHEENIDEEAQGKSRQNKKPIEREDNKSEETQNKSRENKRQNEDREKKVNKGKPSDAIIQNTTVTMNNKTKEKESDNEKKNEKPSRKETYHEHTSANETIRSTRTKTRQKNKLIEENMDTNAERKEDTDEERQGKSGHNKKHKEPEDNKSEETQDKSRPNKRQNEDREKKTTKRSKSRSSSDTGENKSAQTVYEDAVSNCDQNGVPEVLTNNATVVVAPLNETVVLEKGTVVKNEDENEQVEDKEKNWTTPPPKSKSKKQQIKEIFSPYEKTSMKNKVEAFERFGSASKQTGRGSRIPIKEESSSDPVKVKPYTPFPSKFLPKTCSTSKINRLAASSQTSLHNDSGLSMKSLSALKVSQAEYREREKRRQEKEREAQMKKDALLQAQAEEKRRKREEKQLKAQQQREIMQKEKDKLLELHKLKEEKHKQAIAEKEEKLQRAKEEAEKKRQLVKKKAKLVKSNEAFHEENMLPESDKTKRTRDPNQIPIYMTTKPPLLPTGDCYDSDDDEYRKNAYVKPNWSREECMRRQMYVQLAAGEKVKNSLFCCKVQTPDLTDIFEVIDPKKLKRTSSASWKKPPRYTLFSTTSDIIFSEDSDGDIDA